MTEAQFIAAINELYSRFGEIKIRGGRASQVHQDKRHYSRKDRRDGKRIKVTGDNYIL